MKKKKAKVIIGVCAVAGVACAAYFLGKKKGVAEFVQKVIDKEERSYKRGYSYEAIEWPVFETKNKEFPGFLYEIQAQCIGD